MDEKRKAVDLLRKAANLLVGESEDLNAGTTSSTPLQHSGQASTSTPLQHTGQASTSTPLQHTGRTGLPSRFNPVTSDLRRIFQPYRQKNRSTLTGSTSQTFWTHRFFCLSNKDCDYIPPTEDKRMLFEAGLGEKKIKFIKNDSVESFTEILETNYPKLKGCGGWELLRVEAGSRSCLSVIKPDKNGYSSEFLAGSYLGQAICYVRPIQEDLSIEAAFFSDEDTCKQQCKSCGVQIPLLKLRDHVDICKQEKETALPIVIHNRRKQKTQPICSFLCSKPENEDENVKVSCPVCLDLFDPELIETHAALCGEKKDAEDISESITESDCLNEESHRTRSIEKTLYEMKDIINSDLILACYQKNFLRGRLLDPTADQMDGKTFTIFVSRDTLFEDALSELNRDEDVSFPLEVVFVGESAADQGGPRREFLTLILNLIKEKLLMDGKLVNENDVGKESIMVLLKKNAFKAAGMVMGISLLQGGPTPNLFQNTDMIVNPCDEVSNQFIEGLKKVGILQLCLEKKQMLDYFSINKMKKMEVNYGNLVKMMKPKFSPDGSNAAAAERRIYRHFLDYLKEVTAQRRGNITLQDVLRFVTGAEEIPSLGFSIPPTIEFKDSSSPIPTSSTCTCVLSLSSTATESKEELFNLFDYAFCNTFFGIV